MNNKFLLVALLAVFFLSFGEGRADGIYPDKPNPPRLVNDFTQTLSSQEQQQLEQKLVAFDESTSTQISVVIMRSVGGNDINQYAAELGEKWGIGEKGKNNGLIILVAKEDRKVAIQVGRGLEPVVTDALSKRMIETVILPNFKQGNFYGGIDQATSDLMSLAKGEFSENQYLKKHKGRHEQGFPWGLLPVLLVILLVLVFRARTVGSYARTNNMSFWAALALMNMASGRQNGSWGNFSSGSGGFGSGGGGFGGFGGGSFGGGGASGSW